MNVHLIKSPELDRVCYEKIVKVVGSISGPIKFVRTDFEFDERKYYFLNYTLFPKHPFQYSSNQEKVPFMKGAKFPLSWRELFFLCEEYRSDNQIPEDDFVILLTDRKNALNWFSASDGTRNVFIHTAEWEHYTTLAIEYPIAHQIAENIFQVLMNVDLVNIPNKYVHAPFKGCINDVCMNKFEVIAKLKSGSICYDCIMKIRESFQDWSMAKQLKEILLHVRNKYDLEFFDLPEDDLSPIIFDAERCQLTFQTYNTSVPLYPLEAALYLYYLENPEGIALSQLKRDKNEIVKLASIYINLNPNVTPEGALAIIEGMLAKNFCANKSKINKRIAEKILDSKISKNYIIGGERANPFYIHIARNPNKIINNRKKAYQIRLVNNIPTIERIQN